MTHPSWSALTERERYNLVGAFSEYSSNSLRALATRIAATHELRRAVDAEVACDVTRFVSGCSLAIPTAELQEYVSATTPRLMFLTSYFGHPVAAVATAAAAGIPLVVIFETISESYAKAFACLGIDVIPAPRDSDSAYPFLEQIGRAIERGRHVATVFDAPHQKGHSVPLLGCTVRTSFYYALIAQRYHLDVVPVFSRIDSSTSVTVNTLGRLKGPWDSYSAAIRSLVPSLFSLLDQHLSEDPSQYKWDDGSVFVTHSPPLNNLARHLGFIAASGTPEA